MSMFGPRFYTPAEPNYTGLFRLIDDFDKYSGQNTSNSPTPTTTTHGNAHPNHAAAARHPNNSRARLVQTFVPKFDLKETEAAYELHGELPGVEKENVHVEFSDAQTIVIRGRVERSYPSSSPAPAAPLVAQKTGESQRSLQPTVEDDTEDEEGATIVSHAAKEDSGKAVAEQQKAKQQQQQQHKYWITERSVGEFSRTFQFPGRVDPDHVRAALDNGILTVVVPKAKRHESRRIEIQ